MPTDGPSPRPARLRRPAGVRTFDVEDLEPREQLLGVPVFLLRALDRDPVSGSAVGELRDGGARLPDRERPLEPDRSLPDTDGQPYAVDGGEVGGHRWHGPPEPDRPGGGDPGPGDAGAAATGGTARQNRTALVAVIRARVMLATGPSTRRGAGSPKGARPPHRPRAVSGRIRTRSRSSLLAVQPRMTGEWWSKAAA